MASPLTLDERERVHSAIAAVESRTPAILDVMVTRVSDRYALYPLIWAGFGAVIVTALVVLLRPATSGRAAVVIELSMLMVLTLVFDYLPIRISIVPKRVQHAHARQLANRAFAAPAARGAEHHRNRVLIFVSISERYVQILADQATHGWAPEGTWNKIVDDFVATVKTGRIADGLIGAVEACGAVLQAHSPGASADHN